MRNRCTGKVCKKGFLRSTWRLRLFGYMALRLVSAALKTVRKLDLTEVKGAELALHGCQQMPGLSFA